MVRFPPPLRILAGRGAKVLTAFGALALLIAWPPSSGRLLLVPLSRDAAQNLVAAALADETLLVARGPLPGSIVVDGRRRDVAEALAGRAVILLAARTVGCGAAAGAVRRG
ncbi:hypothetical protein [Sphingosinicella sp. BN140058]|uniref:hypothetical protein n=1 Tax=Sphingosinicella sp. BN140058 TaxID=1892855 RepID=UPI0010108D84|nr:hypothetical protein [Sphingosinicella sp. BN140058]QAY76314.1 hypothetical protein ETR14_07050 [Sphingosinicella sp. BN140058]